LRISFIHSSPCLQLKESVFPKLKHADKTR